MIKFASRHTHSAPRHRRESGFQPTNSCLNGTVSSAHTYASSPRATSVRAGGLVPTTSALLFRVCLDGSLEAFTTSPVS